MRYRRIRKRRVKQKKILIIGSLSLLLFLCAGYAAFSTNLSITAKGNIVNLNAAEQLRKKVVSSGEGLYVDVYDNSRYVYKGMNPDNYILFNDELWRIVSIENDDTLKIILNSNIGYRQFDSETYRNNANNTFCTIDYHNSGAYQGCNVWGSINGTYTIDNFSGTVTQNASLNDYLNNEYYNSLNGDKKYIDNHVFFVGYVINKIIDNSVIVVDDTTEEIQDAERKLTWQGKIGLLNSSDFLKASSNSECNSYKNSRSDSFPCSYENGNYLDNNKQESWTINPVVYSNYSAGTVQSTFGANFTHQTEGDINGGLSNNNASNYGYLARPTLYLIKDIKLEGDGTEDSPFLIKPYSV